MGLPIWREPETKSSSQERTKSAAPETRDRVSSGRVGRRPPRNGMSGRGWSPQSVDSPTVDLLSSQAATGEPHARYRPRHLNEEEAARRRLRLTNGLRRQQGNPRDLYPPALGLGVPPISTLLDTARRADPPPPPEREFLAERAEDNDTNETLRRTRPGRTSTAAVSERVRLIEETSRVVSSLGRQGSPSFEASHSIPAGVHVADDLEVPHIPSLRREQSLRGYSPARERTRVDGLGDRTRSISPHERWETMRSTILPDTTLPSAESSFTSAAASRSFTDSSASTDPEGINSASLYSPAADEESESSVDLADMADICAEDDESLGATEALARDMYYREMELPEGRERIAEQEALRMTEGNRFAMANEPASVDIGFRLIEAALERVEDRHRGLRLQGQARNTVDFGADLARLSGIIEDDRARQTASRQSSRQQEAETSQDPPEAHPVSPPTARMQNEMEENLTSGSEPGELDSMRNIVEALASREDVPDEWWMSMGLNISRARPRRNRQGQNSVRDSRVEAELSRVAHGRVQRIRDETRDRASRL